MADGDVVVLIDNDRHAALTIRMFQHFIHAGLVLKYIYEQRGRVRIQRTQGVWSGRFSVNA